MFRISFVVAMVLVASSSATAQPALEKPDPKALVTKVYSLKPIFRYQGKGSQLADTDAVIKVILETMSLGELKPGAAGPQLIAREGQRLEVRATADKQEEIGQLLTALAALTDLAVDVEAEVIELNQNDYRKLLKAIPNPGLPILYVAGEEFAENAAPIAKQLADINKLLKAGRVVQTSSGRFGNGIASTYTARQSVVTYHNQVVKDQKPTGTPQFVKDGFKLIGTPSASADRRFIRLKLTEQSTIVTGMRKQELGEGPNGAVIVGIAPELSDVGATASTTVADGGTVLFRLAYAPKDKVWLVVLRPTIFIQEEEDLRKQEAK